VPAEWGTAPAVDLLGGGEAPRRDGQLAVEVPPLGARIIGLPR